MAAPPSLTLHFRPRNGGREWRRERRTREMLPIR